MRSRLLATFLLTIFAASAWAANNDLGLLGFKPDRVTGQRRLEERFISYLSKDNVRDWIRHMSARPHHVGSPYGKEVAEFIRDKFSSWGFDTRIEEYQVLFPTPRTRQLEMVAPERFRAQLEEPSLPQDSTSGQKEEQLPSYNAYSIDGDVEGELVFVNYGVPADYEQLERRGIDVRGKIVIARYGGSWRGIKPKVAAERGAIGCILYSDPRDDGYFQGDVYPKGPYRMDEGAQRGSVQDMPTYPGDPLTPGRGAVADAQRLDVRSAPTLTRIPVLPISYADALPLLRAMDGPVAPAAWRGALPLTYHLGPGPARVHLKLEFNWDLKPAYDVIAVLRGSEYPDQWIMRGNHHDAWVNGASDPISGMAATMEEARAIGELIKTGWRPRRTIVYAGWDAEEPGLLGSTEWAEHHAQTLRDKLVVYINSDSNGRGFLRMAGSHSLERFINEVARDVTDPQTGVSVWQRAQARQIENSSPAESRRIRSRSDLRISALGSGSDYTPFLQHLGIASLNLGFGGENGGGSYHSIFDSFDHYSRFGDPGFEYGVKLAETAGRAVLRLADADVLPFDYQSLADTINTYVQEVSALADRLRSETAEHNRRVAAATARLAADPRKTFVAPQAKDRVPHVNFAPLRNALDRLEMSASQYRGALKKATSEGFSLGASELERLNTVLMHSEAGLTRAEGLPGRPWYIHYVYAPGFYTGYGVKTLPAVRETIEQREWNEMDSRIRATAAVFEELASEIDQASRILSRK